MKTPHRNGNGPKLVPVSGADVREELATAQAAADASQTAADADQTAQDTDQTGSERDQAAADIDQTAADRDQTAADRDEAADPVRTVAEKAAYEKSRDEREQSTHARLVTHAERDATASARILTATERDAMAAARDEGARRRDARAEAIDRSIDASNSSLADQLQLLRAQAAADRARAAADRERAAADRALSTLERTRLEDGLRTAHLDDLTGAYRRGMGRLAISNEIERARRGDGRFVLAFVDIDEMKGINVRHGHAAGDLVLQALVRILRSKLRPFDPVIRYGGDEFVCGLGGVDLADAEIRFRDVDSALRVEVGVGISVGLATLEIGETPDQLTARADARLLEIKASRVDKQQITTDDAVLVRELSS
jgi:diguanylate cyclase (GGDEF)-like protein